ncbi:MAG TPA: hypothetical protein VHD90_12480, partial [Phototrophicaceae bacterium]|nr:hypothetical protein [Phototrophicaceae bacterium]
MSRLAQVFKSKSSLMRVQMVNTHRLQWTLAAKTYPIENSELTGTPGIADALSGSTSSEPYPFVLIRRVPISWLGIISL